MQNLAGRDSVIENSVDINANMTDMNLVGANDQTNIASNIDLHGMS